MSSPVVPVRGLLYMRRHPDPAWYARGRSPLGLPVDPEEPPPLPDFSRYSDTNRPYTLRLGESLYDNIPAGVPIVNASAFTTSRDIYAVLQAVESSSAANGGVYVQLDAGVYTLNQFRSYGANNWLGFANSSRRVMGWIGAGPPRSVSETIIRVAPGAVNNSPGARDYAINAVPPPVPIGALYLSGSNTDRPFFFSGIRFQGTLQTPFSQYSAATRAYFRMNQTVASPLPWRGISLWRANPGSIMQYCLFEGFGFALNTAPPMEMGAIDTNYSNGMLFRRIEIDGRIAGEIDPTRPRASGGLMLNKSVIETIEDSWQHRTRRSGFAFNTNTNSQAERVYVRNFQVEEIANVPNDGWAGDNGFFNGSNVEEMVGQMFYENVRFNVASGSHVALAVPARAGNGQDIVLPGRAIVVVRNGMTDDTLFGGLWRMSVSKTPNSAQNSQGTNISPAWVRASSLGIDGSGLFDVRNDFGDQMSGVRAYPNGTSDYNPAIHDRRRHFIVTYAN